MFVFPLLGSLFANLFLGPSFVGIIFVFIQLMYLGTIFGLIVGLIEGIKNNKIFSKTEPNQGIWNSSRNALKLSLIFGPIVGLIISLSIGLSLWMLVRDFSGLLRVSLSLGLPIGSFVGLMVGLHNGGLSCIKHFNLRRILYRKGYIPWNYARFLDYASELLLMKKVGGGYVFYHRMLMEHFANMKLEQ